MTIKTVFIPESDIKAVESQISCCVLQIFKLLITIRATIKVIIISRGINKAILSMMHCRVMATTVLVSTGWLRNQAVFKNIKKYYVCVKMVEAHVEKKKIRNLSSRSLIYSASQKVCSPKISYL